MSDQYSFGEHIVLIFLGIVVGVSFLHVIAVAPSLVDDSALAIVYPNPTSNVQFHRAQVQDDKEITKTLVEVAEATSIVPSGIVLGESTTAPIQNEMAENLSLSLQNIVVVPGAAAAEEVVVHAASSGSQQVFFGIEVPDNSGISALPISDCRASCTSELTIITSPNAVPGTYLIRVAAVTQTDQYAGSFTITILRSQKTL